MWALNAAAFSAICEWRIHLMDQYFLGKFVVVRSYSAGVHAGIVESVEADRDAPAGRRAAPVALGLGIPEAAQPSGRARAV